MKIAAFWLALGILILPAIEPAAANNIAVTNIGLFKYDTNTLTADVYFDLAWENSWRDGANRDAAWVFMKFRAPGTNGWEHAILSTNSSDHRPASAGAIAAVPDGMGVFVYSATNRTGSVNYARTRLCWNYGSNGYAFAMGAAVEVSAHAIEMVYIPEGAFCLGSSGNESGHFFRYPAYGDPFLVTNETGEITVGSTNGYLYYTPTGSSYGDGTGIVSNAFPKGYAAFYCMKYEISQGQFADFLNKLTTNQANNNFTGQASTRHTISRNLVNYYSAGAPDRACNYLTWPKGAAYADWAALRPLTELEYEKACRGTGSPVSNEYAWGSTSITQLTAEAGNTNSGTSTVSTAGANCNYSGGISGPTRVGIFAARTNATRQLSGAGYYGVLELSGNVFERCVTVGHSIGRGFTGQHGNGILTSTGYADASGWPGTDGLGSGLRGSSSQHSPNYARTSDRIYATYLDVITLDYAGYRCVRAAP